MVWAVLEQRPNDAFSQHLDDLLTWLSGTNGNHADAIDRAFAQQRLSKEEARSVALQALDAYLFDSQATPVARNVLGLGTDTTTPENVRDRYRRLIKVFHPDRNPEQEMWATRRAEQINAAYEELSAPANMTKAVNKHLNLHTQHVTERYSAQPVRGPANQRFTPKPTPLMRSPVFSIIVLACCGLLAYTIMVEVFSR